MLRLHEQWRIVGMRMKPALPALCNVVQTIVRCEYKETSAATSVRQVKKIIERKRDWIPLTYCTWAHRQWQGLPASSSGTSSACASRRRTGKQSDLDVSKGYKKKRVIRQVSQRMPWQHNVHVSSRALSVASGPEHRRSAPRAWCCSCRACRAAVA